MTAAVMATAKKRQMAVMYAISASTFAAKFEACCGYIGKSDCTVLVCSLFRATLERWTRSSCGSANVPAAENHDAHDNGEDGQDSTQANNPENGGAIAGGFRIVLKAKEQQMIDRRTDFSSGSVDQAETHVAGRVFDAVEGARDAAVGSDQHDAAGVGEDVVLFVEGVTEICGGGRCVNRLFLSGVEVPSGRSFRAAVSRRSGAAQAGRRTICRHYRESSARLRRKKEQAA